MSELKQRGRKNYTEKHPPRAVAIGEPSASGRIGGNDDGHDDSSKPKAQNNAPMSLQVKMLLVLGVCSMISVGAIAIMSATNGKGGKGNRGAKGAYFNTRASKRHQSAVDNDKRKRSAPSALLARSQPDPWDRENDGSGGIDHAKYNADDKYSPYDPSEDEGDDEDDEESYSLLEGKDDGQRYNLAPYLAPLLRGALYENNKANLGINSDQFVHGDDDDTPDDEELEERALLKQQEEALANRDVPMAADLKRAETLREKLAKRLLLAKQPKVKVLNDINATEFYIAVGQSEPVLVTNASQWCTKHNWTLDFIRAKAGESVVGIETSKSNRFYANEGLKKKQMKVGDFLDVFTSPTRPMDYYLAEEGLEKMPELEKDLNIDEMDFANFAVLDRKQLWVGAGGQVSPLHHDQWDNILCQVQGRRTFYLYDPLQVDRLYPKSGSERHFSQVDPSKPDYVKFPKFKYARQYRVDVEAGQMIILPAYWWHQVHHGPDVNVGVNYWFVPASLMSELLYDVMLPDGYNY